ncbi:MAG: hypothetical protein RMM28_09830, partial [Thermoleophilia bacterium]|nr:hypothetical protein [Thermoleophilia bacterium]
HSELEETRVDLQPAAAWVVADALHLERHRSASGSEELPAQAEAERRSRPRGEQGLERWLQAG